MKEQNGQLFLEGKKFISSRAAAEISKYASDYIGQLCRTGKLISSRVGRSWYVSEESLYEHIKLNAPEQYQKLTTKKKAPVDTRKLISARQASEISGYATDYIGQLCRLGKLECSRIGRSWFVSEESLFEHVKLNSPSEYVKRIASKTVSEKVSLAQVPSARSADEHKPSALVRTQGQEIKYLPDDRELVPNLAPVAKPSSTEVLLEKKEVLSPFVSKLSLPALTHPNTVNKVGALILSLFLTASVVAFKNTVDVPTATRATMQTAASVYALAPYLTPDTFARGALEYASEMLSIVLTSGVDAGVGASEALLHTAKTTLDLARAVQDDPVGFVQSVAREYV